MTASGMSTKLPAQALAHLYPDKILAGQLLLVRSQWALRVSGDEFQGYLLLEGERAGSIFPITTGMPKYACIVEPFGWFPAISLSARPTQNSEHVATLGITESGPVLVGVDTRDRWDTSHFTVTAAGQATEAHDLHSVPQYEAWSVEICHVDRPFHSLATLLEVDQRKLA